MKKWDRENEIYFFRHSHHIIIVINEAEFVLLVIIIKRAYSGLAQFFPAYLLHYISQDQQGRLQKIVLGRVKDV